MKKNTNILITGSKGLLGSALKRKLIEKNYNKILSPSKKVLNLLDLKKSENYFKKKKPKIIFHCANAVYGIGTAIFNGTSVTIDSVSGLKSSSKIFLTFSANDGNDIYVSNINTTDSEFTLTVSGGFSSTASVNWLVIIN